MPLESIERWQSFEGLCLYKPRHEHWVVLRETGDRSEATTFEVLHGFYAGIGSGPCSAHMFVLSDFPAEPTEQERHKAKLKEWAKALRSGVFMLGQYAEMATYLERQAEKCDAH